LYFVSIEQYVLLADEILKFGDICMGQSSKVLAIFFEVYCLRLSLTSHLVFFLGGEWA
jgi:hypothetical protein